MRGLKVDQLTCGTIQVTLPSWEPPESDSNIMAWCQDNSYHWFAEDKRHRYNLVGSGTKDRKAFGRASHQEKAGAVRAIWFPQSEKSPEKRTSEMG